MFIPAKILKKKYEVYGLFYTLIAPKNTVLNQRCLLEIYTKGITEQNRKESIPDALVIMMNPGSSKPIKKSKFKVYTAQNIELLAKSMESGDDLVITKPDRTQYQIMRIMENKNWSHVRVVNLSDIRNPKSHLFNKKLKALNQIRKGYNLHSLFSQERVAEQKYIFNIKDSGCIICAWGLDRNLENLGQLCKSGIPKSNRVVGLQKDSVNLYYHPLQRGGSEALSKWVDNICKLIG